MFIRIGREIDLLKNYPRTKRNVKEREEKKTEKDCMIARQFGRDFFDGDRRYGYGGFRYDSKFWKPVMPAFINHFQLNASSSVLDVGCAKGFMLVDMIKSIPGIIARGVDISVYAIEHAHSTVKKIVSVANATKLPFEEDSFDVVISVNTIHNLERDDCATALQEIERVSRGKSFVTVDAYRNNEEKERMDAWNLTAKTYMHVNEWKVFFKKVGYTGDYYWFFP